MPRGIIQNELNMIMREASTQAMIESQKKKQEKENQIKDEIKLKPEVLIKPTKENDIQCEPKHVEDGSLTLICALALSILIK